MIVVCYVVDAPFLGGAEMYVSRLATALDRRRFRPVVMMKAPIVDAQLSAWAHDLDAQGVPVVPVPMHLPFSPPDAISIWRQIDRMAPQIVHVNVPGPYDGQMGLLLPIAKAAGARNVVTEHLPMVAPLWKRAAVKRMGYRSLDIAVTMTHANAHFLAERQRVPPERIRVVPNGVPRSFGSDPSAGRERRWALGIRDSQVVIIYVGNILPHKGLRRLIEALSRSNKRDRFHLLVVGTGPDEAACRQLAADRGIPNAVTFLGWRSAGDTEAFLAAGDVLALPSEIEGLPYVVLEAMASGLPVIAGNVYGLPEVVEDGVTGLLVDPNRIEEITAALERLAENEELRHAMGEAARARFERYFTLEQQAHTMESIYEELLHGKARTGEARP
jgi:glycosyltransferase involved in cell wall biosynthesis